MSKFAQYDRYLYLGGTLVLGPVLFIDAMGELHKGHYFYGLVSTTGFIVCILVIRHLCEKIIVHMNEENADGCA